MRRAFVSVLTVALMIPVLGVVPARAASSTLVVNEIDYDQPSTDAAEFLEIKNVSGAPVDLAGHSVELVNGTGGGAAVYQTIALPSTTLAAGGYLVVCANAATVANCDLDVAPDTNLIQNGAPDAVAIRLEGTVVDTVSYEGETRAPYTEGSGVGLEDDPSLADHGISRCADGVDTDRNNVDFAFTPATPGAANDCPGEPPPPGSGSDTLVINEVDYDQPGTDTAEFVEIKNVSGSAIDLDPYTVELVNGTGGGASVYQAIDLPGVSLAAGGYFVVCANAATVADCDLDVAPDSNLIQNGTPDAVAIRLGSTLVDTVSYEGNTGAPYTEGSGVGVEDDGSAGQGISRCPDGLDTDQNNGDFLNSRAITPGEANDCPIPPPPFGGCGEAATMIWEVQGSGTASPLVGQSHVVEGVVVGDFQGAGQLGGYFLQEEDAQADGAPATSDGIFIFDTGLEVSVDEVVRVQGTVTEFFGLTEINNVSQAAVCSTGTTVTEATVTLPVASLDVWETVEGMLITIPHTLYASGNFTQGRFGEVDLSVGGPLDNPTNVVAPGAPALALQDLNDRSRIQLDDGSTVQNPLPLPPYLGPDGTLRTGDTVPSLTGVLSFGFGVYEVHPIEPVEFTRANPRPQSPPEVGGSLTVAAYNVLNYFTTLDGSGPICGPLANQDCRGADNAFELERQRAKLVAALAELDADVVGFMEIENHPGDVPTADLVAGINDVLGAGTYDYIATGAIGSDAIRVALIYKSAEVTPVGDFAILDSAVDPGFDDQKNRPALAQTFGENGTDDVVTVAVNHLKSKGSDCNDVGDPDAGDGQGNCNGTRNRAAQALVDWLGTDPTGSGSAESLITGDLNSYAREDPINTIESAGYTDLIEDFVGTGWASGAYSFNFQSQSGYLDHGLASSALTPRVTGAAFWHVNADEPAALDYNDFNQPALFNPDQFRSSDHDPVIVGVCETTAPVVEVTATPNTLWPPDHKYRDVTASVSVTDADPSADVELVSVTSNEPDNGEDDGNTINDIVILDDFHFELRAERSGVGTGRVYTITYLVTDACGNSTSASATVTVPLSLDD
jgi:predicted extracellular nuclease